MREPRPICLALAAALALAACATVELENTRPARDLARAARPPGEVYLGWRVFQDRCARCHGADANGSPTSPDLLVAGRTMGPRRFVDAVLRRYDWTLPPAAEDSARDARLDELLQRRAGAFSMPDWQGEPRVTAHIADLYAYLSARSEARQGPGRPAPRANQRSIDRFQPW
jgi:mono/diheme cytochrome c family protein